MPTTHRPTAAALRRHSTTAPTRPSTRRVTSLHPRTTRPQSPSRGRRRQGEQSEDRDARTPAGRTGRTDPNGARSWKSTRSTRPGTGPTTSHRQPILPMGTSTTNSPPCSLLRLARSGWWAPAPSTSATDDDDVGAHRRSRGRGRLTRRPDLREVRLLRSPRRQRTDRRRSRRPHCELLGARWPVVPRCPDRRSWA